MRKISESEGIMPIEEVIQKLQQKDPSYTVVGLHEEPVSLDSLKALVAALKDNPYVTTLELVSQVLLDQGAAVIGTLTNPALTKLITRNNHLSDSGIQSLLQIPNLQFLDISYNNAGDASGVAIAKHPTLTHVDASFNLQMGNQGVSALIAGKLKSLDVRGNGHDKRGLSQVFANTTLQELTISNAELMKDKSFRDKVQKHISKNSGATPSVKSWLPAAFMSGRRGVTATIPGSGNAPSLWC